MTNTEIARRITSPILIKVHPTTAHPTETYCRPERAMKFELTNNIQHAAMDDLVGVSAPIRQHRIARQSS
jgi:hypothetical protein